MKNVYLLNRLFFGLLSMVYLLSACRKEKDPELYIREINTEFLSCRAPYEVLFTAIVSEATPETRYLWDFGDKTTSTLATPIHQYKTKGIFNVKLTVFNPGVDSLIIALPLNTDGLTLTSRFTYSAPTGGIFADFSKICFANESKYASVFRWDFGDGQISTEKNPCYTYTTPGRYKVKLTAICGSKDTAVSEQFINVTAPPKPRAGFVVRADKDNYRAPATIRFENRSTYASTYIWDFGNGDRSFAYQPSYVYREAGDYLVRLYAIHKTDTNMTQQVVSIKRAPQRLFISRIEADLSTFQLPDTVDDGQVGFELYAKIYDGSFQVCETRVMNGVTRFPYSFHFPSDIRSGNTEMQIPRNKIEVEFYDADLRNQDDLLEDFELSTSRIISEGYPRTMRVTSGGREATFYLEYD